MILYPAIDLKDGRVVRLHQGNFAQETVFGTDPAAQASDFAEAGCAWLHVVDLNGALEGESRNTAAVQAILAATSLKVQLGGGIRNLQHIETWLNAGITRVILGTIAVTNPKLVDEACKTFPGQIAVGLDARDGRVAIAGWQEQRQETVTDMAKRFEQSGVAAIIYTDIHRDGAMQGVNVEATAALAKATAIPVIASGGVSALRDIIALKNCDAPLNGVISGRALYDGTLDITEALNICRGGTC